MIDGKRRYSWSDITFIKAEAAGYRADDARMRGENRAREECFGASPIVRGLAVLDRRCGKRRLATIDAAAEHPFVQGMFELRCAAEGIKSRIEARAERGPRA